MTKKKSNIWPILITVLSSYWAIEASCSVVFNYKILNLKIFNLFVSLLFLYDIKIQFFRDHEITKSQDRKMKHFDYSILILLFSSLPYDCLELLGINGLETLNLIKIVRFVSIYKIYKEMTSYAEAARPFRLALIMLTAMMGIHSISITWIALNPTPSLSHSEAYIKSLYWAVTTLTTTGYGDITPTSDLGRIFTIFTMLTGFSMFGVIVGNISNLLLAKNKRLEETKQKLEELSSFMGHYDIPKDLRREVYHFYSHRLNKRMSENENKIISELPQGLQGELQVFMKMKLISALPIFEGLSKDCIKRVAVSLESVSFSSGQSILKKGDWAEEMYIIEHGEVAVVNDSNSPVATLKHGQCFGEIALLMEIQRTKNVIAVSYCDVLSFKKDDFIAISKTYPELEVNFRRIMDRRIHSKVA